MRIYTAPYPKEYRLGPRVLRAQKRKTPLFICNLFFCCCFPWLLNSGLKCSCAPHSSLHLQRGYPTKGTKATLPQLWEQPHTLGMFSKRKYKCFLLLVFSICHIWLRWDPFCSPSNDNRESKCTSVPHSLPGFLTQRNGHRRWGHTRVSAICAGGNRLRTNGWGKMHLVKRRRKFYLFWKAIKDFNKGQ